MAQSIPAKRQTKSKGEKPAQETSRASDSHAHPVQPHKKRHAISTGTDARASRALSRKPSERASRTIPNPPAQCPSQQRAALSRLRQKKKKKNVLQQVAQVGALKRLNLRLKRRPRIRVGCRLCRLGRHRRRHGAAWGAFHAAAEQCHGGGGGEGGGGMRRGTRGAVKSWMSLGGGTDVTSRYRWCSRGRSGAIGRSKTGVQTRGIARARVLRPRSGSWIPSECRVHPPLEAPSEARTGRQSASPARGPEVARGPRSGRVGGRWGPFRLNLRVETCAAFSLKLCLEPMSTRETGGSIWRAMTWMACSGESSRKRKQRMRDAA